MRSSKFKQITTAICLALIPVSVYAAGLGKLDVASGLGEPLKAEIELLSVSPEELSSLSAAIASEEAYSAQGLERPAAHSTIKVEVGKNASGSPVLKLRSSQPINDPYLDMLLQVDWASGRLLREYTVLLDPPGYTGESDGSTGNVHTPSAKLYEPVTQGTAAQPMADSGKKGKSSKRAKKPVAVPDAAAGEYVTKRGDTLAQIAQEMKPEGVSLDQMLIGLYETNPDAFAGKNINRLRTGQILRAPSQETLEAISQGQAHNEVKVHAANWNEYRNKLAGMVAEAPTTDTEVNTSATSGKIKSAEDKSAADTAGSKDVVKLSAGEAKVKDDGTVKSLEAKIAALQEEVTAREKGLQEAQGRASDLEKQIADMQKLLAMKNGTMADMQKQAEQQAAQPKPAETAAEPKPAEVKPAEAKPAEPKPVEAAPPAAEQKPHAAKPPVKKPVVVPSPEPVEEPSMLDSLNLPLLGGGAGLLAALGGAWMYLRNKRKKNLADFEQGIMTSGGLKANTVFGNTSGSSVDTGDTSFLTDFSQSANGGMIDTHDVDPIAEAEVYMAYGRDAQAEEILKDAITKEPKRYELHLKLLEMYAASKNMSAFETVAGELYTTLGGQDPVWAKVAAIGIQLEPNNPLYQASSAVGAVAEDLNASDFADSPLAEEKDLDFNLNNDELAQGFAATQPEEISVEADMDSPTLPAFETEQPKAEDSGLDFDIASLGSLETSPDTVESTLEFSHTLPDLDMSATVPEVDASVTTELDPVTELPSAIEDVAQDAGLSFEMTAPELSLNESAPAEIDFESTHVDVPTLDFSAESVQTEELPVAGIEEVSLDPDVISLTGYAAHVEAEETPDLSGFNLEVTEPAAPALDMEISADEPAEVETKLDLVKAYLDMEDKVGAKELLDEVLKEGGPTQRKRAEDILQSLA